MNADGMDLSDLDRQVLTFALNVAEKEMAADPNRFIPEDHTAVQKLRLLTEPGQPTGGVA